ncbi:MAG: SDR family NAD(P)-dependent oxidoreductase, partial [Candidatus Puniceispirillaceae bacterium]
MPNNPQPTSRPDAKTAIITGGARGIGLATAHLMHEDGWNIVLVDWDEIELQDSAKAFTRGLPLICDISNPEQVEQMIARAIAWSGRIDALINNAGVADFGPIEETDFERWRAVMATNLDGVFLASQAATPALKKTRGAIV